MIKFPAFPIYLAIPYIGVGVSGVKLVVSNISKVFSLPENLTYPFLISTQRVAISSCILNLKNERLNHAYPDVAHKLL